LEEQDYYVEHFSQIQKYAESIPPSLNK